MTIDRGAAMKRSGLVPALAAASLVLAGCSTSGDTSASPSSASSATAGVPLSLVVIGDSIPYNAQSDCPNCRGFVTRYAEALAEGTGREVVTTNRSQHTGLTLPGLMRELPDLRDELSGADVIIIGIAHNSFPLNDEAPCGSPVDPATGSIEDWSRVDETCAAQATTTSRPVFDELYSTVARWRAGTPTILLTVNRYNDWIGFDGAQLTPAQAARTVLLHDAWNTMLCDSAESNGFDCVDVYHAFNGDDGSEPSADLLADDYTHPSQLGNDEIARLLTARGYAPLG
ncbi:SGNH/GDSL hydrolase family protein [uncultured Phycicoccus sp.]|uniref:SGNH/GDSL hydrolase family protein n=1 Tax=uncultured Phycicoccus sp. TaxID=661422 RepID=UPI00262FF9A9|nr:SGNH/GDSL hydrolase family protein [uncultured Phycicoccus sp.]